MEEEFVLPKESILEEYELNEQDENMAMSEEYSSEGDNEGAENGAEYYDEIQHPGVQPIVQFTGHFPSEVYAICQSSYFFVSGGGDDQLCFWSCGDKVDVMASFTHEESVCCLARKDNIFASGWVDGKVRIYCVKQGVEQLAELEGIEGEVEWLQWHPSNFILAGGGQDGSIWVWTVNDDHACASQVFSLGTGAACVAGTFSGDGRLLLAGGGNQVCAWEWETGRMIKRIMLPSSLSITCITSHPTLNVALVAGEEGELCLCPLSSSTVQTVAAHSASIESIVYCPSAGWVTAGMDGRLIVFAEHNMAIKHSTAMPDGITCMSMQGTTCVIGCGSGLLRAYDVRTGTLVNEYASNGAPVLCMTVENGLLMVGTAGGYVNVYELNKE